MFDSARAVFLRPEAHKRADALIETATTPIVLPWLEVRVRALVCVVGIAFGSLNMPYLMGIFGTSAGGEGCSEIDEVLGLV